MLNQQTPDSNEPPELEFDNGKINLKARSWSARLIICFIFVAVMSSLFCCEIAPKICTDEYVCFLGRRDGAKVMTFAQTLIELVSVTTLRLQH